MHLLRVDALLGLAGRHTSSSAARPSEPYLSDVFLANLMRRALEEVAVTNDPTAALPPSAVFTCGGGGEAE